MTGLNNYSRGNIYRDKKSIEMMFKDLLIQHPDFVGSEAFIVAYAKSEEPEGQLTADLIYFGCTSNELVLLGGTRVLAKVPFEKMKKFHWKEFSDAHYYFPPAIPPKRAGVFEINWENSDGNSRNLLIMFPAPAIFGFELEYPSQLVHQKIVAANEETKFLSESASETHEWILQYLPTVGIPNEVNDEPCSLDEYLGFN